MSAARKQEQKPIVTPTPAPASNDIPRHPQPIEPSVPESIRPGKDPEAAPFVPPRPQHKAKDVSPGTRRAPPARPQQPSVDSISRAEGEGMTAPDSTRPAKE